MNIPPTGPNAQKSKFFDEVSNAFGFLAVWYTLSEDRQHELLEHLAKLNAEQLLEKK